MKWIIVDLKTSKALYGVNNKTLMFSSYNVAKEVADQFFKDSSTCLILSISFHSE